MPRRRSSLLSPTALLRHKALSRGAFGGSRGWLMVGVLLWAPVLRHKALYRGTLGGSSGWQMVGVLLWVPKLMRRVLGKQPQVLTIERLVAGQAISIEAIRPPTRRERKAARRAR